MPDLCPAKLYPCLLQNVRNYLKSIWWNKVIGLVDNSIILPVYMLVSIVYNFIKMHEYSPQKFKYIFL